VQVALERSRGHADAANRAKLPNQSALALIAPRPSWEVVMRACVAILVLAGLLSVYVTIRQEALLSASNGLTATEVDQANSDAALSGRLSALDIISRYRLGVLARAVLMCIAWVLHSVVGSLVASADELRAAMELQQFAQEEWGVA